MKTIVSSFTFVFVLFAATVCLAADDLNMGTWKLDEVKSTNGPGMPKNTTVVYAMVGDNVKISVDGVDANGAPMHNEWIGKFDGKDYPVTGDPASDTRAYTSVNDHTLTVTTKKSGKITMTGLIFVSADGKIRTVNVNGRNAKGKSVNRSSVYEKQ
jgi:hypothetical protein